MADENKDPQNTENNKQEIISDPQQIAEAMKDTIEEIDTKEPDQEELERQAKFAAEFPELVEDNANKPETKPEVKNLETVEDQEEIRRQMEDTTDEFVELKSEEPKIEEVEAVQQEKEKITETSDPEEIKRQMEEGNEEIIANTGKPKANEEQTLSEISEDFKKQEEIRKQMEDTFIEEEPDKYENSPESINEQDFENHAEIYAEMDSHLTEDSEIIDKVVELNPVKEENDDINLDYVDQLEGVLFQQRLMQERERMLKEGIEKIKKELKEQNDLSYIQRKKLEKEREKALYEDLYGVEKELAEARREAIEKHENLEKLIKKTGGLNQDAIQQKKDIEAEFMLGDSLDDFIQASLMSKNSQQKLHEKFPEVKKQIDADAMMLADQNKFENKNLRRADGVTKLFNKENPEVEKEMNGFMKKLTNFTQKNQKTLKVAGQILTGVALVTNPVGTLAAKGVMAIMKTKAMQNFKDKMSNDIGHGLDKMGYTENSKLRRGLKLAGAVAGLSAVVGVSMLAANEVDMADIAKQASSLQDAGAEFLTNSGEMGSKLLTEGQAAIDVAGQYGSEALADLNVAGSEAYESMSEYGKEAMNGLSDLKNQGLEMGGNLIEDLGEFGNAAMQEFDELTGKLGAMYDGAMQALEESGNTTALEEQQVNMNDLLERYSAMAESGQLDAVKASMAQMVETNDLNEFINSLSQESAVELEAPTIDPTGLNMSSYTIQGGDTLGAILETVDGVEYDLQGSKLHAVAQLIAEQAGIPDADVIQAGQEIKIPSSTADLQLFVEQNQERINEIMQERIQQANIEAASGITLPEGTTDFAAVNAELEKYQLLSNNLADLGDRAFESSDISNRELYEIKKEYGLTSDDLEEYLIKNITNQLENGTFPNSVTLQLEEDGQVVKSLKVPDFRIQEAANMILQENGMPKLTEQSMNGLIAEEVPQELTSSNLLQNNPQVLSEYQNALREQVMSGTYPSDMVLNIGEGENAQQFMIANSDINSIKPVESGNIAINYQGDNGIEQPNATEQNRTDKPAKKSGLRMG